MSEDTGRTGGLMFVVVEGPNGVGKTTIGHALASLVEDRFGCGVCLTCEPSDSPLGQAIRTFEDTMPPQALAHAVFADRLDHLERLIKPALAERRLVICDRYVPSSLVLQVADGLAIEAVWDLNRDCLAPDVVFYLEDAAETIRDRLEARGGTSAREVTLSPERELELYRAARSYLDRHGWRQAVIKGGGRVPSEIAGEMADQLAEGHASLA